MFQIIYAMKSTLLTAFLGLSLISFSQITVPQEQKSLYGVVEATWCGNCGQYGIPTTNNVISQVGNKAIFFSMHANSSSALHSPTATSIANTIGTSGQPHWTLNGVSYGGYSGSIQNTIINAINTNYNASTTDVNVGFEWNVANDTIYVETLTKFFNSLNGDYYLAVYVSEDDVYAYQANYDPMIPSGNIYHDHILRTSFSTNAFGTMISTGAVSAGTTFSNIHKLKVDPAWSTNNIHISVVLWRDNGAGYDFINANGDGVNASDIVENDMSLDFFVYPNPVSNEVNISFTQPKSNVTASVYDVTGKVVFTEELSNDGSFSHNLNLTDLSSGVYYLKMTNDKVSATQKVIIQ